MSIDMQRPSLDKDNQTADTFGFKWKQRATYESENFQSLCKDWLIKRYELPGISIEELISGKSILDAGCGAGHSAILLFGDLLKKSFYTGVDVSSAVDVAKCRFKERDIPGTFLQTSLTDLPKDLDHFDIIFSEGVLHHTSSTFDSFKYLATRLKPGGLIMIYVYRKKAPTREFVDDFIRGQISKLSNEDAWNALMPLTELGKSLGELDIEIELKKPIDILDIPAGKYKLQRLLYWNFFKAFYSPHLSLDEMNHINFDWYRPQNCHRHTPEEVQQWGNELGLQTIKLLPEEAGITFIARKPMGH